MCFDFLHVNIMKGFAHNERGISPVIGVILMVAIVVIITGTFFVYSNVIVEESQREASFVESSASLTSDSVLTIEHRTGDHIPVENMKIVVKVDDGDEAVVSNLPHEGNTFDEDYISGDDIIDTDTEVDTMFDEWTAGNTIEIPLKQENIDGDEVDVEIIEEENEQILVRTGGDGQDSLSTGVLSIDSIGETGSITFSQNDPDDVVTVNLQESYDNPVVVVKPPTYNDDDPVTTNVKDRRSDSFDVKLDQWDYQSGVHGEETLQYLVVEEGVHEYDDGMVIEAGVGDTIDGDYNRISFEHTFNGKPAVVSQGYEVSTDMTTTTRHNNVRDNRFDVKQQVQRSDNEYYEGTVGYIVLETTTSEYDGEMFEAGRVSDLEVDHEWHTVNFNEAYNNPVFIGHDETSRNVDARTMRQTDLTGSSVDIFLQEEESANSDGNLAEGERVGWFVFEDGMKIPSTEEAND